MISTRAPQIRVVIFDGEGSLPLETKRRFEILCALLEKGYPVSMIRTREHLTEDTAVVVVVLGQFVEGQPRWSEDGNVFFREISGKDTPSVLEVVEEVRSRTGAFQPGGWKPWFPVIDYERCVNCLQCLSFCLFGVYGTSPEGILEVQHEANCKTGCPACARVCPEAAIIFPKYHSGPINGDTANTGELRPEVVQINIPSLLEGDTLQTLRDRNTQTRHRFSKDRDEDQARAERRHHLQEIQKALDIPDELIKLFPGADSDTDTPLKRDAAVEPLSRE